jgi:hypothetical protein
VQDNNLTLRLIAGIVLFAVTGTLSGIQLYHRDREARRLFERNKNYGEEQKGMMHSSYKKLNEGSWWDIWHF